MLVMKRFGDLLAILGGLAGIIGIWFSYQTFRHESGGELKAWHQQRELHTNSSRTIFVCLDNINTDLSSLSVTPVFDNPSKYSIKDFSLSYTLESANVSCEPTGFYSKMEYNDSKALYRYNFETLKPYTETEPPFRSFKLKSRQSRCRIETKATYDGADYPYIYNIDVWFIVVDRKNISEENWRLSCKKAIFDIVEDKEYDIYYYTSSGRDYVFDVNLAKAIENEKESVEDPKISVENESDSLKSKAEQSVPSFTETMPFMMREVKINSFELIKGEEGRQSILRINYDPSDKGGWAVIAWQYRGADGADRYESTLVYLAPDTSERDITLYDEVRRICKVAQAVSDPSLKKVTVEKDILRADYALFSNPNRKAVCVYRYDKEKNQIMHVTLRPGQDKRVKFEEEFTDHVYDTYLIPIKKTVWKPIVGTVIALLMLVLVVLGWDDFEEIWKDVAGRRKTSGQISIDRNNIRRLIRGIVLMVISIGLYNLLMYIMYI